MRHHAKVLTSYGPSPLELNHPRIQRPPTLLCLGPACRYTPTITFAILRREVNTTQQRTPTPTCVRESHDIIDSVHRLKPKVCACSVAALPLASAGLTSARLISPFTDADTAPMHTLPRCKSQNPKPTQRLRNVKPGPLLIRPSEFSSWRLPRRAPSLPAGL